MNKNKKSGKKVVGIAMAVIMIVSIFATFAPAFGYKRPVDAPAGGAIYYMSPQDSTVSGSFCNDTEVQIHVNSTQDLTAGYVTLTYNSSCANITGFTSGSMWTAASGTWVSPGVYFIDLEYTPSGMPTNVTADDYHVGDITIHCNSTTYCKTGLTFNYTACAAGSFCTDLWALGIPHITPLATENGTFTCGGPEIEVEKKVEDVPKGNNAIKGGGGTSKQTPQVPQQPQHALPSQPTATATPTHISTLTSQTPVTTSTATQIAATPAPEDEKRQVPGFGVPLAIAMIGLLAVMALRGRKG